MQRMCPRTVQCFRGVGGALVVDSQGLDANAVASIEEWVPVPGVRMNAEEPGVWYVQGTLLMPGIMSSLPSGNVLTLSLTFT